jgi:hypothetical protein
MPRKSPSFTTPPCPYTTTLANSVTKKIITPDESQIIELFISEVNVLHQITDHRKYRIARAIIVFREYISSYLTCTTPEVYVAIERYCTKSNHKESTQRITLVSIKQFLIWLRESEYNHIYQTSKRQYYSKTWGKNMPEVLSNPQLDPSLQHFSYLDGIVYPNKPELEEFIKNHQENVPLIQYACKVAISIFQGSAQLSLEVKYDPESLHIMLFLMARQEHYSDEIEDIYDKIERIRMMYENSGLVDTIDFLVMTDFQSPLEI